MPIEENADRSSAKISQATGSLIAFFALTYALMWACFFTVAFRVPGTTLLGHTLLLLGTFAPSLSALFLTWRAQGRTGVQDLLGGIFKWEVNARWYVFAIGYIAAIKLAVALLHRVLTGAWPTFGDLPWHIMAIAIIFSTPVQAGEEIGWRGYALPRLEQRFGLAWASVLLGVIWAVWHLPQFFVREADTYSQSFFIFVLQVTAVSVAMAWLWERTGRSLLLTMLMHASANNTKDIVPSATPGGTQMFGLSASLVAWLTVAMLCICAAYFLIRMRRRPDSAH